MPKKSTAAAARANAARRSQTSTKSAEVTLVRQPKVTAPVASASTTAPDSSSSATPASKPAKNTAVPATARPRAPEVAKTPGGNKSAQARTAENVARPAGKTPGNRLARAQATQRARAANAVSPEQYSYVKYDLRLIGILAAAMFLFMIILHFLLPVFLPQ